MDKAFELWEADQYDQASNLFERIAKAEKDNWLPYFYVAEVNIARSWSEKNEQKLKNQLDKAQEYINFAKTFSENNAELLKLQAELYTVWISFDGMTYGMKYSGKVSELYQKALQLAPKNPRIILAKAQWDMGSAKYFGQPVEPYCKDIERAIELFATFKPQGKYEPTSGEERAKEALKQCKAE
ncbi:hypothetical protein GCM10009117_14350 [Gangjinia marincola]|uniref:Tetratricopeptide repeat protein n=2 Tax=Gangjinia marincola TaxID=578463 RepID=A0ABN1MGI3_9FLAO